MQDFDFIAAAHNSRLLCFDVEFDSNKYSLWDDGFEIDGISFASLDNDGNIISEYVRDLDRASSILETVFPNPDIEIIAHNAKADILMLRRADRYPCDPASLRCTMILLNLVDCNLDPRSLGLKPTIERVFNHKMVEYEQAAAGGLDTEEFRKYSAEDAYWELRLFRHLRKIARSQLWWDYYTRVLGPSSITFADIELAGLCWDLQASYDFFNRLQRVTSTLQDEIFKKIGKINLNSPKQVYNRLFREMGLEHPDPKKPTSVDASVMDALAGKYPICNLIRAYRTCTKLVGTYIEPCQDQCHRSFDNRIHSTFWLVSNTGRTRCSNINNQNLPVAVGADLGKFAKHFEHVRIRNAVRPKDGRVLIDCDLSQIELRQAAHVTRDPFLLSAYQDWKCYVCGASGTSTELVKVCPKCRIEENEKKFKQGLGFWQGRDLHTEVIGNLPAGLKFTRMQGKVLNFAVLYNASPWRLHFEHPDISVDKWEVAISQILGSRPKVVEYHKRIIRALNDTGVVTDMFGRRRTFDSRDWMTRSGRDDRKYKHYCNMAINFPIQSACSGILQIAQNKLRAAWIAKGWWLTRASIINSVHDEILVEADEEIAEEVLKDTLYWMENACKISVPIRAEGGIFQSWGDAK